MTTHMDDHDVVEEIINERGEDKREWITECLYNLDQVSFDIIDGIVRPMQEAADIPISIELIRGPQSHIMEDGTKVRGVVAYDEGFISLKCYTWAVLVILHEYCHVLEILEDLDSGKDSYEGEYHHSQNDNAFYKHLKKVLDDYLDRRFKGGGVE